MVRLLLSVGIDFAALLSAVAAWYPYRISNLRRWQIAVILIASAVAGVLSTTVVIDLLGVPTAVAVGVGMFGLVSFEGISYVLVRDFERRQLSGYLKTHATNYAQLRRHWLFGRIVRHLEPKD